MRIKEGDLYQHCYSYRLLSYSSLSTVRRSSIKWKELIPLSTTETYQNKLDTTPSFFTECSGTHQCAETAADLFQ